MYARDIGISAVLCLVPTDFSYPQTSDMSSTKPHNLNVSRLVLQLSLPNPLKSGVKSGMKT